MKRLVVIFALALLLLPAGKSEAARYISYYHPYCHPYYHYYVPRPAVVCGVYHRVWIPGYWRWDWHYHRYFRVHGYWY